MWEQWGAGDAELIGDRDLVHVFTQPLVCHCVVAFALALVASAVLDFLAIDATEALLVSEKTYIQMVGDGYVQCIRFIQIVTVQNIHKQGLLYSPSLSLP